MRRIICDLDGTLTVDEPETSYDSKLPNIPLVKKLRYFSEIGYKITIFTARNMHTYDGDLDMITSNTLPIIEKWLEQNQIPYDEIIIGKPWCENGFYIDDKAIRPDEFIHLNEAEILTLVR